MSTSGFLRTVSPEMHTINLICTFIYKDVQTEQYIFLQSAEIVKILLYLLLSRTILSQNTQKYPHLYVKIGHDQLERTFYTIFPF